MDVGMSSIQAYKAHKQEGTLVSKVHKQRALSTSSQASLHSGCTAFLTNKQSVFFNCCNLELISISSNYHAATDVGMLGWVPLVCAPCLCSFLFVCFVGLYAGHPYSLHPFDFIWNLFTGLFVHFFNNYIFSIILPTNLIRAPPTPAKKRCL